MNQLIKISFLMIYLLFNAGMSYSLHYCSEQLESITLYAEEKKCCSENAEDTECCLDVFHHDLKNGDQNLLALTAYQFQKADFSFAYFDFATLLHKLTFSLDKEEAVPPQEVILHETTPLYLKHQIFLI